MLTKTRASDDACREKPQTKREKEALASWKTKKGRLIKEYLLTVTKQKKKKIVNHNRRAG
jgi:hypothetical protein